MAFSMLFVTDVASYVIKAGTAHKVIFPNMTHLTCLAHGLHGAAETIRANFPLVGKLVSSVKKVFVKAPYRKEAFKAVAPSCYTEHLEKVRNVVNTFDPKSAASIQIAQDVLKNAELENNLFLLWWLHHVRVCNVANVSEVLMPSSSV
jgi:hypothetical protein